LDGSGQRRPPRRRPRCRPDRASPPPIQQPCRWTARMPQARQIIGSHGQAAGLSRRRPWIATRIFMKIVAGNSKTETETEGGAGRRGLGGFWEHYYYLLSELPSSLPLLAGPALPSIERLTKPCAIIRPTPSGRRDSKPPGPSPFCTLRGPAASLLLASSAVSAVCAPCQVLGRELL
jgi:hypothetical protein